MIRITKSDDFLYLEYEADDGTPWAFRKLEKDGDFSLKNTFYFTRENLYNPNNLKFQDEIDFFDLMEGEEKSFSEEDEYSVLKLILGKLEGEYYEINRDVIFTKNTFYIHKDSDINEKYFTAIKNISIFRKIDSIVGHDIYISGPRMDALPLDEFHKLLREFPNSYELEKYTRARISMVLKNYFVSAAKEEKKFNNYLNKKPSRTGKSLKKQFIEYDLFKYESIVVKLREMLCNEDGYNEKQWQCEILEIIQLLFPKYIQAISEVPVKDDYNKKTRRIDYMLVNSNGNVDLVEIKKPFDNCIVTKGTYRDNYIPLRELSGTIMQIEKYIYHLNKWGKRGENYLTHKYKNILPNKFQIKITNPGAFVIMGRDIELTLEQLNDFEVIKRKYKNIIDIITYDDLIKRLEFTIDLLKSSNNKALCSV